MALEAGVSVIPVAMIGTFETQPAGQIMPKIKRVGVRVGRPLDFSRYQGKQNDRFVLRSMTDEIMYELMVLSGQEYVDVYASTAKREIEEAHRAASESVGGADRARPGPPRAVSHEPCRPCTPAGAAGIVTRPGRGRRRAARESWPASRSPAAGRSPGRGPGLRSGRPRLPCRL